VKIKATIAAMIFLQVIRQSLSPTKFLLEEKLKKTLGKRNGRKRKKKLITNNQ
jgi:hypothetical protein